MICPQCAATNPDEAAYCNACGQHLLATASPPADSNAMLWRRFIGPRADHYLERFRTFQDEKGDAFHLTWHWPAFLVGWLWYLYRKMYLHAAAFLLGGLLPMVLGAGLPGVVIWNACAAGAAHYLYYMHVKLTLASIARHAGTDAALRDRLVADAGGIQPYVWWLGIVLTGLAIVVGIMEAPSSVEPPEPP
jgi:hypothetical protein